MRMELRGGGWGRSSVHENLKNKEKYGRKSNSIESNNEGTFSSGFPPTVFIASPKTKETDVMSNISPLTESTKENYG